MKIAVSTRKQPLMGKIRAKKLFNLISNPFRHSRYITEVAYGMNAFNALFYIIRLLWHLKDKKKMGKKYIHLKKKFLLK